MKIPRGAGLAALFVVILAAVAGGVWAYQTLVGTSTSTPQSGQGIFGSLFPFGSGSVSTGNKTPPGSTTNSEPSGPVPLIRKVSVEEVAGATFATGINGALSIRYVERKTGHIYETPVDSLSQVRLTNTTVPSVHDAVWVTASSSVLRFLSDDGTIENFVGTVASSTVDQELQGSFIKKYSRVVAAPSGLLFGVQQNASGSVAESVTLTGTKAKGLLTSAISSWVPLSGGNSFFLASAPTSGIAGAVYDVTSGVLKKVIGGIPGLEARISPSGKYIALSSGSGNVVSLSVFDTKSATQMYVPRATLVPKCAWIPNREPRMLCGLPATLPDGRYPDDWLLGRVHTNDTLWYIDPLSSTVVQGPELDSAVTFDISSPVVSADGRYALFINRNDQSLWAVELTPAP